MANNEPILGKDKILFVRKLADATKKTATKVLYQVEHTINYENSSETLQTKDGNLQQSSGVNTTIDMNAVATADETNKMMRDAVKNGDVLEIWEVDLSTYTEESGKADALYMHAKLNNWSDPANVEGYAQISTSANVIGKPKEGKVTITKEQADEIQYTFKDLTKADSDGV